MLSLFYQRHQTHPTKTTMHQSILLSVLALLLSSAAASPQGEASLAPTNTFTGTHRPMETGRHHRQPCISRNWDIPVWHHAKASEPSACAVLRQLQNGDPATWNHAQITGESAACAAARQTASAGEQDFKNMHHTANAAADAAKSEYINWHHTAYRGGAPFPTTLQIRPSHHRPSGMPHPTHHYPSGMPLHHQSGMPHPPHHGPSGMPHPTHHRPSGMPHPTHHHASGVHHPEPSRLPYCDEL